MTKRGKINIQRELKTVQTEIKEPALNENCYQQAICDEKFLSGEKIIVFLHHQYEHSHEIFLYFLTCRLPDFPFMLPPDSRGARCR
jgi:hypothetical protein